MVVCFTNGQNEFELDVCRCVVFNKTENTCITFGPTFSFSMYLLLQKKYSSKGEEVICLDYDELADRLGHNFKHWKKSINFRASFSVNYAEVRINLRKIQLWELLRLRQKKITLIDNITVTDIHF